ncbi:MAG: undecaprenyl-diphosphate phosphatase, partial [Candidatus Brocadiaceae bacterium]
PGIALEVCLHFGTLLAIVLVFGARLVRLTADAFRGAAIWLRGGGTGPAAEAAPLSPTAVAVVVGTVPVVLAGLLIGSLVERAFESMALAGVLLIVTGLVLLASRAARRATTERAGPLTGLLVGLAQALALLPGISRSGITIVTGMFAGLEREAAARFSFVLAVPALAGAAVLKLLQTLADAEAAGQTSRVPAGALAAGTIASAAVGTVCLLLLLRAVRRGRLHWFAAYCLPAGLAMAVCGWLGGGAP